VAQNDDLGAPLDVTGQRRPPITPPVPAARGDAASDFAFAKSLVDRGDYELSEEAFRDFLRAYGKDRRVPEATFWLGESYLRRTRYREAAEHFLTVTSKYANAPRAPEAMLKLGISLRGLGANAEACGIFNKVTAKYPNAAQPIRAAVDREKARAQC
jgi:tol-pal system protein YbgF